MLGPVFFLAGDSYPGNPHIEDALRARLAPTFSAWIGQAEILAQTGEPTFRTDVTRRLRLLDQIVPAGEAGRRVVLIGRSSGARVISLLAAQRDVAAVICLGYPFRCPNRVLEPERFKHLADLAVPTLIVQGVDDQYGGIDLTENYALSPSINLMFVQAEHEFHISSDEWDAIARSILAFCGRAPEQQSAHNASFDEAFYLRANHDVGQAVAAGAFVSGEQHYRKHGWLEGRAFRLDRDRLRLHQPRT
ncbi:MAG: hypothetical protein P4L90_01625 [Rhodopila sp.]|nr:hypothetical protein [Rhodopila sp.]